MKKLGELVQSAIIDVAEKSCSRMWKRNTFGLVRLATSLLRQSQNVHMNTNKDGGFACAPTVDVVAGRKRILAGNDYQRVLRSSYITDAIAKELDTIFLDICNAKFGPKHSTPEMRLYRDLTNDFRLGRKDQVSYEKIVSQLGHTCKTHKMQGEVVERQLHASVHSPLKPLIRYLSFCLRLAIRSLDHFITDSKDLAHKLSKTKISGGSKL